MITPDAFAGFLQALHGHDPFPWQERLVHRVLEGPGWPEAIGLPTAAGKTALIDIGVFALAAEACRGPADRRTPRRLFFVVDRRVVVDAAFERARKLAESLREASSGGEGILREVATALGRYGGEVPLQATILRGGMHLDHGWARFPAQPMVCVSTVDQVGSRLLFRGYGVNGSKPNNLLPIQAAFLGNDALILLDEAHMSDAFAATLKAIARYRTWAEAPVSSPWAVVQMSATLREEPAGVFRENDEDRRHEVLGPRLTASKPARLVKVPTAKATERDPRARRRAERENMEKLAAHIVAEARRVQQETKARTVGVIVNRVGTARRAFSELAGDPSIEALLLIGRSRPYERAEVLDEYLPRIRASSSVGVDAERPLFVVATQCIEVGADLDFEVLVTECAPIDALRQRFGRLDRLGRRGTSQAAVVVRADAVTGKSPSDPIYGPALARTWAWLEEHATKQPGTKVRTVDLGTAAMDAILPEGEALAELCTPARPAPVMLPGHLDLWVQTSPVPRPDPDPSLFLHGPDAQPADVQVVWRADLPEDPSLWRDVVTLLPPTSGEALALPVWAVQRWLAGGAVDDVPDLEGTPRAEEPEGPAGARRVALRWMGPDADRTQPITPGEITPGDTIVVPSSYGGCDRFGWHPASSLPVDDLGDRVSASARGKAVLRLHGALLDQALREDVPAPVPDLLEKLLTAVRQDETRSGVVQAEQRLLEHLPELDQAPGWMKTAAGALARDPSRRRFAHPAGEGVLLVGGRFLHDPVEVMAGLTDEDDETSFVGGVPLASHLQSVAQEAKATAQACGLAERVVEVLEQAGAAHDLGKLDPRFQLLLHGGDEVAAAVAEAPLAKSPMPARSRAGIQLARRASGLPAGYRHEATSLLLVEEQARGREGWEEWQRELFMHLVSSHHGCGRPFMPPVDDHQAPVVSVGHAGRRFALRPDGFARLDGGVAERFWRLTRRFGWYGLAYLEAVLRLADHRVSEREGSA
ncbi:type I-G CRISPR-associated helicase/endonuclease Cas3g [Limnochorda pilosa]|uniref:CRISPR-associated helicase Cas3 n=1 Tax=Limnochorda pilosa TaxID=1555112 RepID=A0A0K2SG63_LIMPI|nr:type I-U CRISPR-associated helicase/endonuclease Cas3 [Limnochorda pilosa]BAS26091.1 CRISPR-associated helicase Cas3 [Limnochorda pilosa]